MQSSSVRLCSVAALLVACNQRPSSEEVQTAREALLGTTTCSLGTACALALPFPSQFVADVNGAVDVPVVANGRLTIADGVQLEGTNGPLSNVANMGPTATSVTEVGSRVRLGSLWTNGNVTVRSGAYFGGTLWTLGNVDKQDDVTIVGGTQVPLSGVSTTKWTVTFPTTSSPGMDVPPDTQISIAPRAYQDISVKSRATLTLTTGTYYFDSLTLEPQSVLKLDNSGGTVVINVRGNLTHGGTLSFTGASSDVLIASFGRNDIPVEAEFNGTLLAPHAKIVVGTANGATHDGLFFGKDVEVKAGARIRYKATSGTGPAIESITHDVTGDSSTTPPPPPDTRGLGFKSYQDKWGEYVQSLIDQKYTGPVIEIPTHPDALGKQDPADPTTALPPATTVTTSPLPATYYSDSIDDAAAEARDSIAQATVETQQRLPEIDQTTPAPDAPTDPEPSTWAKGFCPLEKQLDVASATPEERISEGFDLGNQPNRSKTFDAYWYANGEFRAGLDSLYKVYARAAFKTGVGVSVNLTDNIDKAEVFDVLALSAEAAAGSLANDGRLFSVPYLNATVKVFGSDVISYRLPKTISTQTEECRTILNECQKKGGTYDQCCKTWYGNNKVVDTSKCQQNDFCTSPVNNCKATQDRGVGCLEGWSLLFQPWKVDLWHESIDFLNPPRTFTYGAFTLSLNGGTELSIPSYLGVDETGPDVTIAPFGRVFVKAEVAVGAVIYLGVEGQIDVIRVDVPFKGSLKWHFNRSPEVCAAELHSNSSVQMKWSTLNGNIYVTFYMRITNPFTGKYVYIEIARQKVFGWEGFSLQSDPWILARATNPILKLDPSGCVLGGESCATDTTPLFSIGDLQSTGQSYKQVAAPYGQKNCDGQAVGEVTDASLGTLPGLLVKSTWDEGQTTVPCDQRHSQFTIWVQRDEGKMDPSALPSPYYNWEFWDQVSVGGVPSGSGCLATVSGRYRDLPASIAQTVGAAPYSYVKLDRQAAINRVTKVKVVSHATSNCEELPLDYLVLPVYNAP